MFVSPVREIPKESLLVLRTHLKVLQVRCFVKEPLNGSLWGWLPCGFFFPQNIQHWVLVVFWEYIC